MPAAVRVEGVSRLVRTLRTAEVALDELDEETDAGGVLAGARIRPLLPVRTGRLVGSLRVSNGAGTIAAPYAGYVREAREGRSAGLQHAEPGITRLYLAGIERILDNVKGA